MWLNASKQSFVASAAICTLLGALAAVRYALTPYPAEAPFTGGMPLAAALTRFSISVPWLAALLAGVLILWTLVVVVQLTIKYTPATNRNYLPPQIFLIAAGGLIVPGEALSAYIAAWLFILSVRQFIFSFHKGYRFEEVFRAGLYLGSIPLLYAPFIVSAVLIVIFALAIYRRSAREACVCVAGFIMPVPAAGFIHWVMGAPIGHIYMELWRYTTAGKGMLASAQLAPISTAVAAGLVAILVLIAVGWALTHKTGIRKTQYKFIHHTSLLLVATAATALLPGTSLSLIPLLAVPVALCVPYAFSGKQIAASSVIYFIIIIAVSALNLLSIAGFEIP